MLKLSLLLTLAVAVLADDDHEISPGQVDESPVDGNAPQGHELLAKFLHTEKGRHFAQVVSTSKWMKPGQIRGWRHLPLFFENTNTGKFSEFFLVDGNFTAEEAYEVCQRLDGATLASLHTERRWEFVNTNLVAGNYWFGLSRWPKCPRFVWSDGKLLSENKGYWQDNEPTVAGTDTDCVRTVNPPSLTCNATACFAKEFATWKTEKCKKTGFPALCENTYPRPLYSFIPGKFDWKSADAACKQTFNNAYNVGLAMPKTKVEFDNLFYGVNMYYKKWNCWVGAERFLHAEKDMWYPRWGDDSSMTSFDYFPEVDKKFSDTETCGSLYDPMFAESKSAKGFYDFNECDAKLECAICQWRVPLY